MRSKRLWAVLVAIGTALLLLANIIDSGAVLLNARDEVVRAVEAFGDLPLWFRSVLATAVVVAMIVGFWSRRRSTLLRWERTRLVEALDRRRAQVHLDGGVAAYFSTAANRVRPSGTVASWLDPACDVGAEEVLARLEERAVVVFGTQRQGKTLLAHAIYEEAVDRALVPGGDWFCLPLFVEASVLADELDRLEAEDQKFQALPAEERAEQLVQALSLANGLALPPSVVRSWWRKRRITVVVDGFKGMDQQVIGAGGTVLRRAIEPLFAGSTLVTCRSDLWRAYAEGRPASAPVVDTVEVTRADLGRDELERVRRQLEARRHWLSQRPPAGSGPGKGKYKDAIVLADFFRDDDAGLFVEPTSTLSWKDEPDRPIVEEILDRLARAEPTVLLGDPGQGKTLIVQLVFDRLAQRFCAADAQPDAQLPLFVVLAHLRDSVARRAGEDTTVEGRILAAAADLNDLDVPTEVLLRWWHDGRIALLLDGLDELPSTSGGSDPIGSLSVAVQGLLARATVLTSRTVFWDVYRDDHAALVSGVATATVHDIDFDRDGPRFVRAYCAAFPQLDSAEAVIGLIRRTPGLRDLAQRPLTLFMVTDVLAHELDLVVKLYRPDIGARATLVAVYETYIEKWLKIESARSDVLRFEHRLQLARLMAWQMFESNFSSLADKGHANIATVEILGADLHEVVVGWVATNRTFETQAVFDDLTTHNLLISSSAGHDQRTIDRVYRFAHKSFFEYLVANHLWGRLSSTSSSTDELVTMLDSPLPDEVIGFLRQQILWAGDEAASQPATRAALARVRDAFWSVLEDRHLAGDAGVMARQQAANLLPAAIVGVPTEVERLRAWCAAEDDVFIRRGIAVGFALHLDAPDLLDDFVALMWRDPEAMSVHLGYNRVYYGDQPQIAGWRDDGGPRSTRLYEASKRHLASAGYRWHWAMSAATIEALLSDAERREHLSVEEDAATLRTLVRQLGARPIEAEARDRLLERLDEVAPEGPG